MEKQTTTKSGLIVVSKTISALFTPFTIPFVAFFVLFTFSYLRIMPQQYKLIVLGIIFCFTILMPTFTIYLFQKLNKITSAELGERRRRYYPFLLTIVSYLFCLVMMLKLRIPWYMVSIIFTGLLVMVIFFLANLKWRLSEHMGGAGMVVGGLISFSMQFGYNPVWWLCILILITGMLGSARIISGRHSFGEVFFGFLIGFGCSTIILDPIHSPFLRLFF
ncbi:hypothetical protein D0T50_10405 [Bacteroides sp. 214]|uniref:hypothetical protein n=1 Tax=Bacteroides sp. 214 TaxID=2302935 RepID=UPI0013D6B472|nr:hypothetical protein [Bacteroides sp. 214]NDW13302.1 hypothetical protein [Bacteroides sp. 214]